MSTEWAHAAPFTPAEVSVPSKFSVQIPEAWGKAETFPADQESVVVHIQTAHGNYEAQKNIQKVLHLLKDRHGFKTVFVEGSPFDLKPEVLRFGSKEETLKIGDILTRQAIVKGPDLFLLQDGEARGLGLEDLELYKANGRAFREVISAQEKTAQFLGDMDRQIESLNTAYMNPVLRGFAKRVESFEAGTVPFPEWLNEIGKKAEETLKLRLAAPEFQIEWPMLTRYFKILELEKSIDKTALEKEKDAFLKRIKNFPASKSFRKMIENPSAYTAEELEKIAEELAAGLPLNFDYAPYPNLNRFVGKTLLVSELKAGDLNSELLTLQEKIAASMIRTPEEKTLWKLLSNHRLLHKLFRLELTPADYEKILADKEILPGTFAAKFLEINKAGKVRDFKFSHLEEIHQLFDKALSFYGYAKQRDEAMIKKMTARMKSEKISKAVVVTGGFHAGPFQDYFKSQGINYALVTPKISGAGNEEERQAYLNSVLQRDGITQSTYESPEAALGWSQIKQFHPNPEWLRDRVRAARKTVKPAPVRSEVRTTAEAVWNKYYEIQPMESVVTPNDLAVILPYWENVLLDEQIPVKALDFGSGKFILTKEMQRHLPKGSEIHAVDIVDPKYLTIPAGVHYHRKAGEVLDQEFPQPEFDLIVGMLSLEHSNIRESLKALRKIARPGARLRFFMEHKNSHYVRGRVSSLEQGKIIRDSNIFGTMREFLKDPVRKKQKKSYEAVRGYLRILDQRQRQQKDVGDMLQIQRLMAQVEQIYDADAQRALRYLNREVEKYLNYQHVIRLAQEAAVYGTGDESKLRQLFEEAGFEIEVLQPFTRQNVTVAWQVELKVPVRNEIRAGSKLLTVLEAIEKNYGDQPFLKTHFLEKEKTMNDSTLTVHLKILKDLGLVEIDRSLGGDKGFPVRLLKKPSAMTPQEKWILNSYYDEFDLEQVKAQWERAAKKKIFNLPEQPYDFKAEAEKVREEKSEAKKPELLLAFRFLRSHFGNEWVKISRAQTLITNLDERKLRESFKDLEDLGLIETDKSKTRRSAWIKLKKMTAEQKQAVDAALLRSSSHFHPMKTLSAEIPSILKEETPEVPSADLAQWQEIKADTRASFPHDIEPWGMGSIKITLEDLMSAIWKLESEGKRAVPKLTAANLRKPADGYSVTKFAQLNGVDLRRLGIWKLPLPRQKDQFKALIKEATERLREGSGDYKELPFDYDTVAAELNLSQSFYMTKLARQLEVDLEDYGIFAYNSKTEKRKAWLNKYQQSLGFVPSEENRNFLLGEKEAWRLADPKFLAKHAEVAEAWHKDLPEKREKQRNLYLRELIQSTAKNYRDALAEGVTGDALQAFRERLKRIAPGHYYLEKGFKLEETDNQLKASPEQLGAVSRVINKFIDDKARDHGIIRVVKDNKTVYSPLSVTHYVETGTRGKLVFDLMQIVRHEMTGPYYFRIVEDTLWIKGTPPAPPAEAAPAVPQQPAEDNAQPRNEIRTGALEIVSAGILGGMIATAVVAYWVIRKNIEKIEMRTSYYRIYYPETVENLPERISEALANSEFSDYELHKILWHQIPEEKLQEIEALLDSGRSFGIEFTEKYGGPIVVYGREAYERVLKMVEMSEDFAEAGSDPGLYHNLDFEIIPRFEIRVKQVDEGLLHENWEGERPAEMTLDEESWNLLPEDLREKIRRVVAEYKDKWHEGDIVQEVGFSEEKRAVKIDWQGIINGEEIDGIEVSGVLFTRKNLGQDFRNLSLAASERGAKDLDSEELAEKAIDVFPGEDGRPRMVRKDFAQIGGHGFETARKKFENARTHLPAKGVRTPFAVGYGRYLNLQKNDKALGVFISATRKNSTRAKKGLNETIGAFLKNIIADYEAAQEAINRDPKTATLRLLGMVPEVDFQPIFQNLRQRFDIDGIAKEFGRNLRRLVDLRLYPNSPHFNNFAFAPGGIEQTIWYDLGGWHRGEELAGKPQEFAALYLIFAAALMIVARDFYNPLKKIYDISGLRVFESFMEGFFYDQLQNPDLKFSDLKIYESGHSSLDIVAYDYRYRDAPQSLPPFYENLTAPFVPVLRQILGMTVSAQEKADFEKTKRETREARLRPTQFPIADEEWINEGTPSHHELYDQARSQMGINAVAPLFVQELIVPRLKASINPDELKNVLELGAGTGSLWRWAREGFRDWFPAGKKIPAWIESDIDLFSLLNAHYLERNTLQLDLKNRLSHTNVPAIVSWSGIDEIPVPAFSGLVKDIADALRPQGRFIVGIDTMGSILPEVYEARRHGWVLYPYFTETIPGKWQPTGFIVFDWEKLQREYQPMDNDTPQVWKMIQGFMEDYQRNPQEVEKTYQKTFQSPQQNVSILRMSKWLETRARRAGALIHIEPFNAELHIRRLEEAAEHSGMRVEISDLVHREYLLDRSQIPALLPAANVLIYQNGAVIQQADNSIPPGKAKLKIAFYLFSAIKDAESRPEKPYTPFGIESLNQGNLNRPEIRSTQKVLDDIQSVLKEMDLYELNVLLFGSYAEDKNHDGSDLDLILMPASGADRSKLRALLEKITEIEAEITRRLQSKGYREIHWNDIQPATLAHYFDLWTKREFFKRNKYLWVVAPEQIQGYKIQGSPKGDSVVPVRFDAYLQERAEIRTAGEPAGFSGNYRDREAVAEQVAVFEREGTQISETTAADFVARVQEFENQLYRAWKGDSQRDKVEEYLRRLSQLRADVQKPKVIPQPSEDEKIRQLYPEIQQRIRTYGIAGMIDRSEYVWDKTRQGTFLFLRDAEGMGTEWSDCTSAACMVQAILRKHGIRAGIRQINLPTIIDYRPVSVQNLAGIQNWSSLENAVRTGARSAKHGAVSYFMGHGIVITEKGGIIDATDFFQTYAPGKEIHFLPMAEHPLAEDILGGKLIVPPGKIGTSNSIVFPVPDNPKISGELYKTALQPARVRILDHGFLDSPMGLGIISETNEIVFDYRVFYRTFEGKSYRVPQALALQLIFPMDEFFRKFQTEIQDLLRSGDPDKILSFILAHRGFETRLVILDNASGDFPDSLPKTQSRMSEILKLTKEDLPLFLKFLSKIPALPRAEIRTERMEEFRRGHLFARAVSELDFKDPEDYVAGAFVKELEILAEKDAKTISGLPPVGVYHYWSYITADPVLTPQMAFNAMIRQPMLIPYLLGRKDQDTGNLLNPALIRYLCNAMTGPGGKFTLDLENSKLNLSPEFEVRQWIERLDLLETLSFATLNPLMLNDLVLEMLPVLTMALTRSVEEREGPAPVIVSPQIMRDYFGAESSGTYFTAALITAVDLLNQDPSQPYTFEPLEKNSGKYHVVPRSEIRTELKTEIPRVNQLEHPAEKFPFRSFARAEDRTPAIKKIIRAASILGWTGSAAATILSLIFMRSVMAFYWPLFAEGAVMIGLTLFASRYRGQYWKQIGIMAAGVTATSFGFHFLLPAFAPGLTLGGEINLIQILSDILTRFFSAFAGVWAGQKFKPAEFKTSLRWGFSNGFGFGYYIYFVFFPFMSHSLIGGMMASAPIPFFSLGAEASLIFWKSVFDLGIANVLVHTWLYISLGAAFGQGDNILNHLKQFPKRAFWRSPVVRTTIFFYPLNFLLWVVALATLWGFFPNGGWQFKMVHALFAAASVAFLQQVGQYYKNQLPAKRELNEQTLKELELEHPGVSIRFYRDMKKEMLTLIGPKNKTLAAERDIRDEFPRFQRMAKPESQIGQIGIILTRPLETVRPEIRSNNEEDRAQIIKFRLRSESAAENGKAGTKRVSWREFAYNPQFANEGNFWPGIKHDPRGAGLHKYLGYSNPLDPAFQNLIQELEASMETVAAWKQERSVMNIFRQVAFVDAAVEGKFQIIRSRAQDGTIFGFAVKYEDNFAHTALLYPGLDIAIKGNRIEFTNPADTNKTSVFLRFYPSEKTWAWAAADQNKLERIRQIAILKRGIKKSGRELEDLGRWDNQPAERPLPSGEFQALEARLEEISEKFLDPEQARHFILGRAFFRAYQDHELLGDLPLWPFLIEATRELWAYAQPFSPIIVENLRKYQRNYPEVNFSVQPSEAGENTDYEIIELSGPARKTSQAAAEITKDYPAYRSSRVDDSSRDMNRLVLHLFVPRSEIRTEIIAADGARFKTQSTEAGKSARKLFELKRPVHKTASYSEIKSFKLVLPETFRQVLAGQKIGLSLLGGSSDPDSLNWIAAEKIEVTVPEGEGEFEIDLTGFVLSLDQEIKFLRLEMGPEKEALLNGAPALEIRLVREPRAEIRSAERDIFLDPVFRFQQLLNDFVTKRNYLDRGTSELFKSFMWSTGVTTAAPLNDLASLITSISEPASQYSKSQRFNDALSKINVLLKPRGHQLVFSYLNKKPYFSLIDLEESGIIANRLTLRRPERIKKILVVEDLLANEYREWGSWLKEKYGIEVTVKEDGVDGGEELTLRGAEYDLIISDVHLIIPKSKSPKSEISGPEMMNAFKDHSVPAIYVTDVNLGALSRERPDANYSFPAVENWENRAYLEKPVEHEHFVHDTLAVLEQVIDTLNSRAEIRTFQNAMRFYTPYPEGKDAENLTIDPLMAHVRVLTEGTEAKVLSPLTISEHLEAGVQQMNLTKLHSPEPVRYIAVRANENVKPEEIFYVEIREDLNTALHEVHEFLTRAYVGRTFDLELGIGAFPSGYHDTLLITVHSEGEEAAPVISPVTPQMVFSSSPATAEALHNNILGQGPAANRLNSMRKFRSRSEIRTAGEETKENLFEEAAVQMREAAKIIGLNPKILEKLFEPERVLEAHFSVMMDNGEPETFYGNRVLFNTARGAGKGGIRFENPFDEKKRKITEEDALNETKMLAFRMVWKFPLVSSPFGGAKGNVLLNRNAKDYSPRELAAIMDAYVTAMNAEAKRVFDRLSKKNPVINALGPFAFGPFVDVPAPDLNTSVTIKKGAPATNLMDVFLNSHLRPKAKKLHLQTSGLDKPEEIPYVKAYLEKLDREPDAPSADLGVITGKSVGRGGSLGRTAATGQGVFFSTRVLLENMPAGTLDALGFATREINDKTVSIQGFGNVGELTFESFQKGTILVKGGARVTAVSDFWGTIENEKGLNIDEVRQFHKHMLELQEAAKEAKVKFDPAQAAAKFKWSDGTLYNPSTERIFDVPSDIFIPAFREHQIHKDNAERIAKSKKLIVEAANDPTTPEADRILSKANVLIVPDILANAGGATVSYFEWMQNLRFEQWPEIIVQQILYEKMSNATKKVLAAAQEHDVTYRMAANIISLMKVVGAEIARNPQWSEEFSQANPPYKGYKESGRPETIEELRRLVRRSQEEGGTLFKQLIHREDNRLLSESAAIAQKIADRIQQGQPIRWVLVGGPPATGKTFIAQAVIKALKKLGYDAEYHYETDHPLSAWPARDPQDKKIIVAEGSKVFSEVNVGERGVIPKNERFGIFVDTNPSFKLGNNTPLITSGMWLLTEILYQAKQKEKTVVEAIQAWRKSRKRIIYEIYPQRSYADVSVNTYVGYELPLMKKVLLSQLEKARKNLKSSRKETDRKTRWVVNYFHSLMQTIPTVDPRGLIDEDSILAQYLEEKEWKARPEIRSAQRSEVRTLPEEVLRSKRVFTDEDAHLFMSLGQHYRLFEKLGAHPIREQGKTIGTYFAVWAPNAKQVSVVGDFNGWNQGVNSLKPVGNSGVWAIFMPGVQEGSFYKYVISGPDDAYLENIWEKEGSNRFIQELIKHHMDWGIRWKADPFAFASQFPTAQEPERTASIVTDLYYPWNDGIWMSGREDLQLDDRPISIYEIHVGSWKRKTDGTLLNYRELAEPLADYVKQMGFTHVEFLPLTEYYYGPSWGYQVANYFAPTARYGTPQELMYLIDTLHQEGIGVIMDWVPGHFPKDSVGLSQFDGTHLYDYADWRQGEHPHWGTRIFNYGRKEVKSFLISSAYFWARRYHFDAIRVDGVASMLYRNYGRGEGQWVPNEFGGIENFEAVKFLQDMNFFLQTQFPGLLTIAEESSAWSQVTSLAGLGFSRKQALGWMNDTLGEYIKYHPSDRTNEYRHSRGIQYTTYNQTERFVLPLSHDEVSHGKGSLINQMPDGAQWEKFSNLRLLYAHMFLMPGNKHMFMGNEFAQFREWNEDTALQWNLLERLSLLDPGEENIGIKNFVQDLNLLYRTAAPLHELDFYPEGFEWIHHDDWRQGVFSFLRKSSNPKDQMLVVFNMSGKNYLDYRIGAPAAGTWYEIFNSNDEKYLFDSERQENLPRPHETEAVGMHGRNNSLRLNLPRLAVKIYSQNPKIAKILDVAGESLRPEIRNSIAAQKNETDSSRAELRAVVKIYREGFLPLALHLKVLKEKGIEGLRNLVSNFLGKPVLAETAELPARSFLRENLADGIPVLTDRIKTESSPVMGHVLLDLNLLQQMASEDPRALFLLLSEADKRQQKIKMTPGGAILSTAANQKQWESLVAALKKSLRSRQAAKGAELEQIPELIHGIENGTLLHTIKMEKGNEIKAYLEKQKGGVVVWHSSKSAYKYEGASRFSVGNSFRPEDWTYITVAALLTEPAAGLLRFVTDPSARAERLKQYVTDHLPGFDPKAGEFVLSAMKRLVESVHSQRLIETKA